MTDIATPKMGIRTAVMSALDAGQFLLKTKKRGPYRAALLLGLCCRYGVVHYSRKEKKPVKVDDVVRAWIEAIVGMAQAHSKDNYDANDAKADELLGPLLSAPVAQIREFYGKLLSAMEADERVPWLVIMGFTAWGEVMVKDAPDEKVKRLKVALAQEIADLVEEGIKDQIPKAVARALKWRDPETLKEVKAALEGGAKPKLVGKESCLFLCLGRGKKKIQVML